MLPTVNENLLNELKHFYHKLESVLTSNKVKTIKGSLFLTLIKMPPNKISKILHDSALGKEAFYDIDLIDLGKDGLIFEVNDINKKDEYIISALGIWTYEALINKVDVLKLIGFFQDNKFSSGVSKKPLTSTEKIILTSLLALRNFTPETSMNLNDKDIRNCWIEIFNKTADYLCERGFIKDSDWLPAKVGVEHPINNVMRRAQDLPKKTKHIYTAAGDYRYYLNVVGKVEDSKSKIKFLTSLICEKIESKSTVTDLHTFFCNIAYDQAKNVRENFDFINPEWDTIIEQSLIDSYYDQEI